MPVILENGSDQIRTWLDPNRTEWSKELQSLLKPFDRELECYVVSKDVGKVGNNSPDFIVPVASSANKNNIANFFAKGKAKPPSTDVKVEEFLVGDLKTKGWGGQEDKHTTVDVERSEDNAPMPVSQDEACSTSGLKRRRSSEAEEADESHNTTGKRQVQTALASPSKAKTLTKSPLKSKTRSAVSNGTMLKGSPTKAANGSQRITDFFNK